MDHQSLPLDAKVHNTPLTTSSIIDTTILVKH